MLEPLKNQAYKHLFSAQVIALLGTGLTTVALALLAYDLAGENAGTVLGTALALKMIAYVCLAPIAGELLANLPRKTVLVILDVIRAGVVFCLPFVTEIWQIYILIFLMQSCSAGFTPLFQATIPDILPEEKTYTKALSLSRLAYDLESLISPSLAALALLFLSFNTLFMFNAMAFLCSAALVITAKFAVASDESDPKIPFTQKVMKGIKLYLATPRLRGLLCLSMAVAAGGAMVIINTVVIVRSELGLGEQFVALALAAYGGGSMFVALLLPKLLDTLPDRKVMIFGGFLMGLALSVGISITNLIWLLPVWFVLGCAASTINTPAGRLLRRSANEKDRPSLFVAQFSLSHACWLAAYPGAGYLGAELGMGYTFIIFTIVVLISSLLSMIVWTTND